MAKRFISTKTYEHSVGVSACFRQWRAKSHCSFLHGYALSVTFKFQADDLDERNWVVDFGGVKELKQWIVDTFDHKTVVAEDDPQLEFLRKAHELKVIDLVVVPATGCERFSELIFDKAEEWLKNNNYTPRVKLHSVEVREHGANSAICLNV